MNLRSNQAQEETLKSRIRTRINKSAEAIKKLEEEPSDSDSDPQHPQHQQRRMASMRCLLSIERGDLARAEEDESKVAGIWQTAAIALGETLRLLVIRRNLIARDGY